jgi:hypothetical protein
VTRSNLWRVNDSIVQLLCLFARTRCTVWIAQGDKLAACGIIFSSGRSPFFTSIQ